MLQGTVGTMGDSSPYRSSRGGRLSPRRDGPSSDTTRDAVSDPLAELVRLIDQEEAFGEIVRSSARVEPLREPDPLPPWRSRSEPASWQGRHEEPAPYDSNGYAYGETASAPTAAYDPLPYDDGHVVADARPHARAAGHYDHDARGGYYDEGHEEEGHYEGEEHYADPVAQRRRGIAVMAAAVVGLALVGVAGAFGYWAWSSGPRSEPPLIKADTTPNKVLPATQADAAGDKSIYEAGGAYRPPPAAPAVNVTPSPTSAPPPSGVSPNGAPRMVHTETIRPNQLATADTSQLVAPPLTAAATAPDPPPAPTVATPAKQPTPRTRQVA